MLDIANSYISRIVAFVLTPILLPIATTVAVWLQDAIGIDLTGQRLTAYVIAIAGGVAITAATWLRNRGQWEVGVAELSKLYELGKHELDKGVPPLDADPIQPPGTLPRG